MSEYIRQPNLEYQVVDRLKEQWLEMVTAAGGRTDLVKPMVLELSRRYINRGRRSHHNIFHIEDVGRVLEQYRHLAQNFSALKIAGDGHDIFYVPGGTTNEKESAAFMQRMLLKLEMPEEISTEVNRLIMLTAHHQTTEDDGDGKLLIDADLSILAAEPERYKRYTQAIKREYVDSGIVPKKDFRAGRADYLEKLLDTKQREHIFLTEEIRQRWEDAAQHNVRSELQRLKSVTA
jgi:predicted metal-dependent HD superfamily phosphohydrolase